MCKCLVNPPGKCEQIQKVLIHSVHSLLVQIGKLNCSRICIEYTAPYLIASKGNINLGLMHYEEVRIVNMQ